MSKCDQLAEKFQSLMDEVRRISLKLDILKSRTPATVDEAKALVNEIQKFQTTDYQSVRGKLIVFENEVIDADCKNLQKSVKHPIRVLNDIYGDSNFLIAKAADTGKQIGDQAAATQKSTTTTNNAGTGTPGTAGTGPGASKPAPPSPTTVAANAAPTSTTTTPAAGKTEPQPVASTPTPAAPAPTNPAATNPGQGDAQGLTSRTRDQAAVKNEVLFKNKKDWRVRLSLAPESKYLYNAPDSQGILAPLIPTNGVLFPYTPNISVQYNARYDSTPLTHTNYTFFNYSGSSVDQVMITCDFTAQDTQEANYLLAVIHFFRSATKMFFGNDENPKAGTPPPLCYLYGYGQFQFSAHPLVINGFTFSLPDDCDYIRADVGVRQTTVPNSVSKPVSSNTGNVSESRLSQGAQSGTGQTVVPGGNLSSTKLQDNKGFNSVVPSGTEDPTYVPTKIQLQISCLPIVSRYDVANKFSLKEYASGALLRGTGEGRTGGMW